jgi:2-polyprenyl-6-hydroxyphenyl methylase/3-demethylubiquinone-9 3-methyltransferase
VGAEYVLKLLPQNTHDFAKFIKPSELADWARKAGLTMQDMIGIHYNPLKQEFKLDKDISVNYLVHAVRF